MKTLIALALALIALPSFADYEEKDVAGAYLCFYELREHHGGAYRVLGQIRNTNPECGMPRAQQRASEKCQSYIRRTGYPADNKSCTFLGCQQDPWLDCSGRP